MAVIVVDAVCSSFLLVELLELENVVSVVEGIIVSCLFPVVTELKGGLVVLALFFYLTQLDYLKQSLHTSCMLMLHVFLMYKIDTMLLLGSISSNVLYHHIFNRVCCPPQLFL